MSLDTDLMILRSTPLLAPLDPEALRLIAFAAEKRDLAAGEEVVRAGSAMAGAMIVLAGSLLVTSDDGDAKSHVARPGEVIGDAALVVETMAPCTATARETGQIMTIPRHLFRRVLAEFPASAVALRSAFSARLDHLRSELGRIERRLRDLDASAARPERGADPDRERP